MSKTTARAIPVKNRAAVSDQPHQPIALVASLIVCLATVAYFAATREIGTYGVETDFYQFYVPTAQALERGEVLIDDYHPPLYGWVVGVLAATGVFPGEFEAGLVLAVLSYCAIVLAVFLIARLQFPEIHGLSFLAAAFTASTPTLIGLGFLPNAHTFFVAISLFSIYYALKGNGLLAGLFAAMAIWTRYTWIISFIPLVFLKGPKTVLSWGIAAAAWVTLGFLTYAYKGSWFFNLGNVNIASGLYNIDLQDNPGLWIGQHEQEFRGMSLIQILLYDPFAAAHSFWSHLKIFSGYALTSLLVPPLGIVAVFGLRPGNWNRFRNPLVLWTVGMFLLLVGSTWAKQYSVALVPLLCLAAAVPAVKWAIPRWPRSSLEIMGVAAGMAGIVTLLVLPNVQPRAVREAAEYLKTLPGATVLSSDPRVFYYSGKRPGIMSIEDGRLAMKTDHIVLSPFEEKANPALSEVLGNPDFASAWDKKYFGKVAVLTYRPGVLPDFDTVATIHDTTGGLRSP